MKVLDEEDKSPKQIIRCLSTLSKKVKMLLETYCPKHNFVKKLKSTLKTTNDLEKLLPDFSKEEEKEEMSAGHMSVFCQNLGITPYTLENYSNFKNEFLFNNGSILKIIIIIVTEAGKI